MDLKATWPPFPCNRLRCVSFGTIFVDWTSLKIFVNIIGYIEKAKTLTVTWFSFFLGCIFISDSCLLTIAIAFWPIAPWTTVTCLVVVARTVWYCVSECLLGWVFKLMLIRMYPSVIKSRLKVPQLIKKYFKAAIEKIPSSVASISLQWIWCRWSIVLICWNRNVRYWKWIFVEISSTWTCRRLSRQSPTLLGRVFK